MARGAETGRASRLTPALAGAAGLILALLAFVGLNSQPIHIDLIFLDVQVRLAIALLATTGIGVLLGFLLGRRR